LSDLYIANDFQEDDFLYYNNCDGTFTESIATPWATPATPPWVWTPPTSTTTATGSDGPRHAARAGADAQDSANAESFDVYN